MKYPPLQQRRLLNRPRELASHSRVLPNSGIAQGEQDEEEEAGENAAPFPTAMASAADPPSRFKENGKGEKLYPKLLEQEPQKTLKRRADGAPPHPDRRLGFDRAGSAMPPMDPRRLDASRGNAEKDPQRHDTLGFDRASDRPAADRNGTIGQLDSRHPDALDRAADRPERSFPLSGRERDDDKERNQALDDNTPLEQHKEKDTSPEAILEVVAQYKAALAELTVNSKIIITKLTIIAGDNIHAAKGIAATICSHILEVPSDQKLPTLYLLDSIVKNIGRDYVELFAARLPEVFCEAYRQVDPSLHPKMKRLFETWREVFTGDSLLVIEAKLQFNSVSSNQLPTVKPMQSPPQRPGHGIHVNPTYLEAQRQRLRHSIRPPTADTPKDGFDADFRARKISADNFLDYDYVCTDIGAKVGEEKEPWEKSWPKEDENLLRSTDEELNQQQYTKSSVLDGGQPSARLLVDAYGNIRVPPALKNPAVVLPTQRDRSKGRGSFQKNWQEEGHGWDEKTPRHGESERQWDIPRKDFWGNSKDLSGFGLGKGNFRSNMIIHDRPSWHSDVHLHGTNHAPLDRTNPIIQRELEERGMEVAPSLDEDASAIGINSGSAFGHQFPADVPLQMSPQRESASLQPKLGPFPIVQPNHPPLLPPAPSGSVNGASFGFLPMSTRNTTRPSSLLSSQGSVSQPFPSLPSIPPLSSHTLGYGNSPGTYRPQTVESHFPMHFAVQPGQQSLSSELAKTQMLHAGNPSLEQQSQSEHQVSHTLPVLPFPTGLLHSLKQLHENLPQLQKQHVQVVQSEQPQVTRGHHQAQEGHSQTIQPPLSKPAHIGQTAEVGAPQTGLQTPNPGPPLLAALLGSAISENLYGAPVSAQFSTIPLPTVPSGQSQSLFPTAGMLGSPRPGNLPPGTGSTHLGHGLQPPLPPGPPPLSSQVASMPPQPFTNLTFLLSSLVAQGVIVDSAAPVPHPNVSSSSALVCNQNLTFSQGAAPLSVDGSSTVASSVSSQGFAPILRNVPSTNTVQESLGFEFKADVLRERHDFVVNGLYLNLPEQCKSCGLRCRSDDDLKKHMNQHAPKNRMQTPGKLFRRWFQGKEDWVKGVDPSVPNSLVEYLSEEGSSKAEDVEEPAVPADEDQAVCTLCGEPFEDFYNNETDMWMYKGAKYLKTGPSVATKGEGPIVHTKCQSDSDVVNMDIMEVVGRELEGARKRAV